MRKPKHIFAALLLLGTASTTYGQTMTTYDQVNIARIGRDLPVSALDDPAWRKAAEVPVAAYWSGAPAPARRSFKVRLLWSATALYVRFEAQQGEPLVVSNAPDLTKKTLHLWDRDVCEIFIAPDRAERNKYFEFEVAPTSEWVDLAIEVTPAKRLTDTEYGSGMETSAKVAGQTVVMAVKIPWKAFGRTPRSGDVWLGNLFRCVGKDPDRGYLAWRPTMTEKPNFHVPAAFGEFVFTR